MLYRSVFCACVMLMLVSIVVLFCACIDSNEASSVSNKRVAVHSDVNKSTGAIVNTKNMKDNFAGLQPTRVATTKTQLTTIVSPGATTSYRQGWFRYTVWLLVYLFIIAISLYLRRKTGNYLAEVVNNPRAVRK